MPEEKYIIAIIRNRRKVAKHKQILNVYFLGYTAPNLLSTFWGTVENKCLLLGRQFTARGLPYI